MMARRPNGRASQAIALGRRRPRPGRAGPRSSTPLDREGETDLVFLSEKATPELVRLQRKDAGGLICTASRRRSGPASASRTPPTSSASAEERYPILAGVRQQRLRYDPRCAFGITVNHRTNFTGRSRQRPGGDDPGARGSSPATRRTLSDAELARRFVAEFTSPGHVPLLYSAPALVRERKGHTELAVSLARMAGLSESVDGLRDARGLRGPAVPGGGAPVRRAARVGVLGGPGHHRGVSRMVRVMATGVFDLLHPGHVYFLEEAKQLGDELVVVVARDQTARRLKHEPYVPEHIRRQMVEALKPVDRAILGSLDRHLPDGRRRQARHHRPGLRPALERGGGRARVRPPRRSRRR